jgi:hypothetical protein
MNEKVGYLLILFGASIFPFKQEIAERVWTEVTWPDLNKVQGFAVFFVLLGVVAVAAAYFGKSRLPPKLSALEHLTELLRTGVITTTEFDEKRAKLKPDGNAWPY